MTATSPVPVRVPEAANLQIPVDLFVSRKRRCAACCCGDLRLSDASGNLVFAVDGHSSNSALPRDKKLLLDAAGNALFSIYRHKTGSWQGFKESHSGEKELIFRVEGKLRKFSRTELEVFLVGENCEDTSSSFKIKGCRFQRSCTIYKGNSIVAQTSLMYKLGKVFVGRCRFRLFCQKLGISDGRWKLVKSWIEAHEQAETRVKLTFMSIAPSSVSWAQSISSLSSILISSISKPEPIKEYVIKLN